MPLRDKRGTKICCPKENKSKYIISFSLCHTLPCEWYMVVVSMYSAETSIAVRKKNRFSLFIVISSSLMTEFTVRYIKSIEKYIYCRLYIVMSTK